MSIIQSAQITRDVYDIAPAQRNDLKINTTDDGFHSYGQGCVDFS